MFPNSPSSVWLRHAPQTALRHPTRPDPQKVEPPPLTNPAYDNDNDNEDYLFNIIIIRQYYYI